MSSPRVNALFLQARAALRDLGCGEPQWAARAPGRVNLIGEHTDYNGGLVLPMAIDRDCVVAAAPRASGYRIHRCDTGESVFLDDELEFSGKRAEWSQYVRGLLSLWPQMPPPLDLAVASDVPIGAGLSSSAALEASTATVLEQMSPSGLSQLGIAELCRDAEHKFAGVPCGLMDQLASVCGRSGHAVAIDCRDHSMRHIHLHPEDVEFLIVDSLERHVLAESGYAERREQCERAVKELGISTLSEIGEERLEQSGVKLDDACFKRVRHVVSENARVQSFEEALGQGDYDLAGSLMFAGHASLRDDFEVSTRRLDDLIATAQRLRDRGLVYGARLTGGGFGGAAICLVRAGRSGEVMTAFRECWDYLAKNESALMCVRPAAGAEPLLPSS